MAAYRIYRNESIGAWKKALAEVGWSDTFETNTPSIGLPPGQYESRDVSAHAQGLAV